jgi:hypothetical protein
MRRGTCFASEQNDQIRVPGLISMPRPDVHTPLDRGDAVSRSDVRLRDVRVAPNDLADAVKDAMDGGAGHRDSLGDSSDSTCMSAYLALR